MAASKGITVSKEYFLKDAQNGQYASQKVKDMSIFEVNYAFDQAEDEKDAYMKAWAHCKDLIGD